MTVSNLVTLSYQANVNLAVGQYRPPATNAAYHLWRLLPRWFIFWDIVATHAASGGYLIGQGNALYNFAF